MKKKLFTVAILLSVFFVFVLGYFRLFSESKKMPSHRIVSNKPTINPSPTVKITDGWSIYRDESYGLMFQYPNESNIKKLVNSITIIYSKDKQQINRPTDLAHGYDIEISFMNAAALNIDDFAKQALEGSYVECSSNATISSLNEMTISGKQTKTFTAKNCVKGSESNQYYINNGKLIIQISSDIAGTDPERVVYAQVINTFISSIRL